MNNSQTIFTSQLFSQKQGNIVSDMDGEKVMFSMEKGRYYNLGQIGGEIWDLIKEPISIQEITEFLVTQYEVDNSNCLEQVNTFLKQLIEEELIEVSH